MTKSRMVHPTSDRHVTHVCVFDVGSDLCLICGAGSKTAGQEELEPLPEMGLSAAYKVAKEVRGTGAAMRCRRPWLTPACCAQEIAAVRLPTNRSSWKAKPQTSFFDRARGRQRAVSLVTCKHLSHDRRLVENFKVVRVP